MRHIPRTDEKKGLLKQLQQQSLSASKRIEEPAMITKKLPGVNG